MNRPISIEDRNLILVQTQSIFGKLRGEQILMTGATGFFGKWLTQAFLAAEDQWSTNNTLTLLTRSRSQTLESSPWLADRKNIEWIEGDVREFKTTKKFSTILHAAVAASQTLNDQSPYVMFDTIVDGTRRVLEIAHESKCRRFLFVSSGAVYGKQPESHVSEDYLGAPDPLAPQSAYGEAKRAAEFLCATEARRSGFNLTIARCFAFVGPYLPLDTHFAIGNFILNILRNEPIKIGGDGTPVRSYLYAADLTISLLKMLVEGKNGCAYNIGSDHAYTIAQLANEVHSVGCQIFPQRKTLENPIQIAKKPSYDPARNFYLPAVERSKKDLDLKESIDLKTAVLKTLQWHQGT